MIELQHHGILGMRWGVRNEPGMGGRARVDKKTTKMATKDAKRFAKAKMAYGEGAGVQRRHIKAEINAKMRDSNYKKSFNDALEMVNYAKATGQAKRWRAKETTKNQATRSTKAIARTLTGTSSIAAAGILYMQHKAAVDQFVKNAFNSIKRRF